MSLGFWSADLVESVIPFCCQTQFQFKHIVIENSLSAISERNTTFQSSFCTNFQDICARRVLRHFLRYTGFWLVLDPPGALVIHLIVFQWSGVVDWKFIALADGNVCSKTFSLVLGQINCGFCWNFSCVINYGFALNLGNLRFPTNPR